MQNNELILSKTFGILPLPELNNELINYLDPYEDFKNLCLTNKYYSQCIKNNKLYQELKEFHEKKNPIVFLSDYPLKGFAKTCYYGYLEAAKYLYYKNNKNLIIKEKDLALIYSCRNGHKKIVVWLCSLSQTYSISTSIKMDTFTYSCYNGHKDIAEWLYKHYDMNMKTDIHENIEKIFEESCYEGNLDIVKWLYSLTKININADDEYAFRFACMYGHKDVAEWLYNISIENKDHKKIDIHAKNDQSFVYACINGHFDVVQWLYNLSIKKLDTKIDINVNNEEAFRNSCGNGHQKIAEWLYNIK